MDELNIHDGVASYQHQQNSQKYSYEQQEFDNIVDCSSEILLSKIQYEEDMPIDSPQINYNTASNKIKQLSKTAEHLPFKKSKPYCGCGQYYSCTSSLYLHIRSKHGGQAPPGTIGGPKGIVKKPNQDRLQNTVKVQQNGTTNNIKIYNPVASIPINKTVISPQVSNTKTIIQDNNASNSQYSGDLRSRKRQEQGPKACRICGKTYSCNSSLNLHLKRKHQMRKSWDGKTEIPPRTLEDKIPRNFECSICGLNYGSKSALGLHYNNKHSSKNHQIDPNLPYDQNRAQKCGCGLVYQSRSALNMHVKKKHNGIYPQGTTQKPTIRLQTRQQNKKDIQQYFDGLNNQSDDNQHSIYDSDYEDPEEKNPQNSQRKQKVPKKHQGEPEKPYKCGCGRNYSCSSSLNLHIKKNHNWVVPAGTIGGPRGMRNQQENRNERLTQNINQCQKQIKKSCSVCKRQVKNMNYFQCKTCEQNHVLCSKCFWQTNTTNLQHEWQVIKKKQK